MLHDERVLELDTLPLWMPVKILFPVEITRKPRAAFFWSNLIKTNKKCGTKYSQLPLSRSPIGRYSRLADISALAKFDTCKKSYLPRYTINRHLYPTYRLIEHAF